jgi:hypothetical protein
LISTIKEHSHEFMVLVLLQESSATSGNHHRPQLFKPEACIGNLKAEQMEDDQRKNDFNDQRFSERFPSGVGETTTGQERIPSGFANRRHNKRNCRNGTRSYTSFSTLR